MDRGRKEGNEKRREGWGNYEEGWKDRGSKGRLTEERKKEGTDRGWDN